MLAHAPQVSVRPVTPAGLPGGFDVAWDSPTEGPLTFGTTAPLTAQGAVVPIDGYPRYDNPWSHTPFDARTLTIADRAGGVTLDFTTGRRTVTSTHPVPPVPPPPPRPPFPGHDGGGHDGRPAGHHCSAYRRS